MIFLGGDRKYEGDGRFGGVFGSAPQHRNGMSVHKGLTTLIGAALGATDQQTRQLVTKGMSHLDTQLCWEAL